MDASTVHPIRPASGSLHSHLSALSALIAQLDALPSQTRWPAYIPLTSRARISGEIQHPNEVKVNLGDGWWVDMTASEAAGYLRRRKAALLEEQARLMEGNSARPTSPSGLLEAAAKPLASGPIMLNPLFLGVAGPATPAAEPSASEVARRGIKSKASSETSSKPPPAAPADKLFTTSNTVASSTETATSLEEVLDNFLASQKLVHDSSAGTAAEGDVTEDGLPIHEIRETPSGEIIGSAPEPTQDMRESEGREVEEESSGDYWSEAAKARRRALFDKVFGEASDISEEDDVGDDAMTEMPGADGDEGENARAAATSDSSPVRVNPTQRLVTTPPPLKSDSPAQTPPFKSDSPAQTASPDADRDHLPARRPSASQPLPPRSILKVPPSRKKSVSFDESVPVPPDSPESRPTRMGFQLSLADTVGDAVGAKVVPVIPRPVPGGRKTPPDGFAGMKRGFLDPPGKQSAVAAGENVGASGKKKPSLFAQRMAQQAVKESPNTASAALLSPSTSVTGISAQSDLGATATTERSGLPKMSQTPSTAAVRPAVVENAVASSSKLAQPLQETPTAAPHAERERSADEAEDPGFIDDDDYDDEEEDEEDEYDLDDALLAREVALEYHRRRAYRSPYLSQDPDDPNYGHIPPDPDIDYTQSLGRDDGGGVMLAMPQVQNSGAAGGPPTIVNPTPDDFRRYVRVGKLENGNLVLAPGEEGWSSDEEGGAEVGGDDGEGELERERRKKRDNRRKVKDILLGKGDATASEMPKKDQAVPLVTEGARKAAREEDAVGLPPVVRSASGETTASAVGTVKERGSESVTSNTPEPPKKVSRFKAARMGA